MEIKQVKRGDRVSLNTTKRTFYFQDGEYGIHLMAGSNEVAIIPEKATDQQLSQINHAIRLEHLVFGWPEKKSVVVADKEGELEKILGLGRGKVSDWIFDVRDDKKIKMEKKVAQIEKLISLEKTGKKRTNVIDIAERALSYLGGVSPVEETEKEKVEIKLTSGNVEEKEVK